MSNQTIVEMHEKSSAISSDLASIPLSSIREILPDKTIIQACQAAGYQFRRRLIVPVVTVLHMVLAAIWPEESFNASWDVLWSAFKSRYPQSQIGHPSRGTVSKAPSRLPLAVWQELFDRISQQAQHLSEPWHDGSQCGAKCHASGRGGRERGRPAAAELCFFGAGDIKFFTRDGNRTALESAGHLCRDAQGDCCPYRAV